MYFVSMNAVRSHQCLQHHAEQYDDGVFGSRFEGILRAMDKPKKPQFPHTQHFGYSPLGRISTDCTGAIGSQRIVHPNI